MQRIDIIRRVAAQDGLIVANLGFPARELFSVHDRPGNFYMLGSMGLASSIGLGLAAEPAEARVCDRGRRRTADEPGNPGHDCP